ncbi:MAG: PD40 domain-containing protein [Candidatus Kerfeldbacteria bacterium]|nr:PD40 domain-containing protein [Candidatus Kerfeldbacteria bacterium]
MNPHLRQILLIAAFAVLIVAFGYIIYVVFFKPAVPVLLRNNRNEFVNGLPALGNGNVNRLGPTGNTNALPIVNALIPAQSASKIANGGPTFSDTLVGDVTSGLAPSGDHTALQYYDQVTGQFFHLAPDGSSKTLLSDVVYKDVQQITWSPDGNKAILEFPDGSKILYDFGAKKQTTLPKELNNFSFSPSSDQLVSKFLDAANQENQWLVITKPDGSQSQTVEHLGANAGLVIPDWSPNSQVVATYQKAADGAHSEIVFLGANGENFPSLTINGRGFAPNWSPDGQRLLYSAYSSVTDDNPRLFITNGSPSGLGSNTYDLGLTTSADKCTFSLNGSAVYCAVPYYMNPGSGPQPELSAGIPDNMYKIDLNTGAATVIARPVDRNLNQRFSAANLQLTPREDALYFTDAITGTVQKIQLR